MPVYQLRPSHSRLCGGNALVAEKGVSDGKSVLCVLRQEFFQ